MRHVSLLSLALTLMSGLPVAAQGPVGKTSRVHNLKVLSDKVDDVTTVENILASFAKPGMSDAERARALWLAAVKYRHQTQPPNEHLAADWEAHDPVKIFNTYGYCMCCCSSAIIEALNRLDGRPARGRILTGHSVPETFYDNDWHMFDASLLTYFPKKGGAVGSVDDIAASVAGWYAKNPEYKKNPARLAKLMQSEQWQGWKRGPELLALCPFYKLGYFPARTHGWNDTMVEYDRKCEVYEYGYQIGHRALFSLRPGESLVREAGNRGLHVNMDSGRDFAALKSQAPHGDLVYVNQFCPGYSGGVVANGYHRYAPDLAAGNLESGADIFDNLASGGTPALHVKAPGKKGIAVVQLASPYVYLGGRLKLKAVRQSPKDTVAISISTNNARTFAPLWSTATAKDLDASIDLKARIFRRYAYWLKIEIDAASADGAGLELFAVENDIQHAPRTLPWLGKGTNTITVAADRDTTLASRTITGRITPDPAFNKNETTTSLGVSFENLDVRDGSCWLKSGVGTMTIPIDTPGALKALGFSTQIRARGKKDLIRALVSFDGGKTWREAARYQGPTPGRTEYTRFRDVPASITSALLRYELTGNGTVGILSFHIDADYRDPLAGKMSRPFQVVHRWTEDGQPNSHTQTIDRLPCTYRIAVPSAPQTVSVTYEMTTR